MQIIEVGDSETGQGPVAVIRGTKAEIKRIAAMFGRDVDVVLVGATASDAADDSND